MEPWYLLGFLFFIYAFLGWCAEVAFHAVTFGKFINRGFLNGPYCPIYGAGALLVLFLLAPVAENGVVLFLCSMVVTSILEFLTGFILEKLFHARWWDYSQEPFHLGPYICLKFSLLWGFACLFVVRLIHPVILFGVEHIPHTLGLVLLCLFTAGMLVDLAATVSTVKRIFRQLEALEAIEALDALGRDLHAFSDKLGEKISASALDAAQWEREGKEKLEEYKTDWDARVAAYREQMDDKLGDWREQAEDYHRAFQDLWAFLNDQREGWAERLEDQRLQLTAKLEEKQAELRFRFTHRPIFRRRLLDAFPALRSLEHQEALEKLREALRKK